MQENVTEELVKINVKLDLLLDVNHGQDVRLTKLEVEAGFIKSGFALLISAVGIAIAWAFNRIFK